MNLSDSTSNIFCHFCTPYLKGHHHGMGCGFRPFRVYRIGWIFYRRALPYARLFRPFRACGHGNNHINHLNHPKITVQTMAWAGVSNAPRRRREDIASSLETRRSGHGHQANHQNLQILRVLIICGIFAIMKIIETMLNLTEQYGKGWSEKHLRHCLRIVETFPDIEIVSTLWRQLSWSHLRLLMYIDRSLSFPTKGAWAGVSNAPRRRRENIASSLETRRSGWLRFSTNIPSLRDVSNSLVSNSLASNSLASNSLVSKLKNNEIFK